MYYSWEFSPNPLLRISWRLAFLYFFLALTVTPINTILHTQKYLPYRKIFGIAWSYFAFFHASKYFYDAQYYGQFWSVWTDFAPDFLSGITAFVFFLPLALTSNNFSVKKLWAKWALVQSLAYPLYILSLIHIAFAWLMDGFYMLLTTLLVWLRTYPVLFKEEQKSENFTWKYVCIPCWYIYDPALWDPDSGIAPWTKFEDIPDTWYCPVCWVSKKDFRPLADDFSASEFFLWEVVFAEYINIEKNVLELKVKLEKKKTYIPGQYFSFIFSDHDGEFRRSFSIASVNDDVYTFLIRVDLHGRAGKLLKDITPWASLKIKWVFWTFTLQDTKNNKVFIATGTGLSPIFNMISSSYEVKNILIFWSKNKEDVFYENEMSVLKTAEKVYICFSREEENKENTWNIEYQLGRMDIKNILSKNTEFESKNTEFYICWNPKMVEDTVKNLQILWYTNIYIEKF